MPRITSERPSILGPVFRVTGVSLPLLWSGSSLLLVFGTSLVRVEGIDPIETRAQARAAVRAFAAR
jgi:hypothetical protein